MSLFVVQHRHAADHCPLEDPNMGPLLREQLSKKNQAAHHITIQGEAVVDGAHALYMILDAPDQERVDQFMSPFNKVGSVEIFPAHPYESMLGEME